MVKLKDVAEMMDMQNAQMTAYLNRQSGDIIMLSDDTLSVAEEGFSRDTYADWEVEELTLAQQVLETKTYLRLPDSFEINEFDIMERFCHTLNSDIAEVVSNAIGGTGTFRRFKQAVHLNNITDDWYRFKQAALEKVAADWLKRNGIAYEESTAFV